MNITYGIVPKYPVVAVQHRQDGLDLAPADRPPVVDAAGAVHKIVPARRCVRLLVPPHQLRQPLERPRPRRRLLLLRQAHHGEPRRRPGLPRRAGRRAGAAEVVGAAEDGAGGVEGAEDDEEELRRHQRPQ